MRGNLARCALPVALLLFSEICRAASPVELDVQPRVLQIGEAAVCTITIRGVTNPSTPTLPPIDGFDSQFVGTQQQFSMGTGGRDRSVQFKYRLSPTKTGNLTIGPFSFDVNGQTFDLPAVNVQVVVPGSSGNQPGEQTQLEDVLFAKIETERDTVYNQEVFDLYVSVYSRGIRLARDLQLLNLPSSGFNLQPLQELRSTREVVNGQVFDVRRFRSKAQALTAGSFTLEPVVQVQVSTPRRNRRPRSAFDEFFGGDPFGDFFGRESLQAVGLKAKPFALTVKSLPGTGQPPGYSGAVGAFTIDVQVQPTELKAGEPITITTTIRGQGNVAAVSAPHIVLGEDFKVYEPKLVTQDVHAAQGDGSKTFEQVVIPKTDQVTELPAIVFSFFDPKNEEYNELARGPFALSVAPAPEGTLQMIQAGGDSGRKTSDMLGRDIVYLKPPARRWIEGPTRWYAAPVFLCVQMMPPLALAALFLVTRRRQNLASDIAKARRLRAPRSARAGLSAAEKALRTEDAADFYDALWRALTEYFGNRLNLGAGEVDVHRVLEIFRDNGLAEDDANRILNVFRACEQARFGYRPGDHSPSADIHLESLLNELKSALQACEKVKL